MIQCTAAGSLARGSGRGILNDNGSGGEPGDRREFDHLIAVTNRHLCLRSFPEQLERVCRRHPKALILREKDLTEEAYLSLAKRVLDICREHGVPCVLHTFSGVAQALEHPYLHLPLAALQKEGGKPSGVKTLGTSIHSVSEAAEAERLGADYLTAGHIYATDCKAGLPPRGLEFLAEVCQAVSIPVYGIGGVHIGSGQLENMLDCGAAGACVMSDMMRL